MRILIIEDEKELLQDIAGSGRREMTEQGSYMILVLKMKICAGIMMTR